MARFFAEGGPGMWLVLFVGVAAIGAALAHLRQVERTRDLAIGLLVACVVVGGGFMVYLRGRVDDALMAVDPSQAEAIREQGYAESLRPLELAIGLAVIGGAIVAAAEARRGQ